MTDTVIVRLKRPSGSVRRAPSVSLHEALASLVETVEVQPLLSEAIDEGKALAIDFFQSSTGQPLLIHFTKEKA
jgi:hypothetical protein